jgi:hypothetical protein
MSLEETMSETRLDNESILNTVDEAATISDAIIAAIDEVEAALSRSLELCWYTKYPMPPAAAAEEPKSYTDRIPGLSGYVERRRNNLREHAVHTCNPSCDSEYCELTARIFFQCLQACYLMKLIMYDPRTHFWPNWEFFTTVLAELHEKDKQLYRTAVLPWLEGLSSWLVELYCQQGLPETKKRSSKISKSDSEYRIQSIEERS